MRDPAPDLARLDGRLVRVLCPRRADALVTDGDRYAWVSRDALEVAEVSVAEIVYLHRGGEAPCDTETGL